MRSRSRGVEPARLEAARRRFEFWRSTRQGRGRIPERLWKSAVKLAAAYGLCRTARTLGLDYNALKRHVGVFVPGDSPGNSARIARRRMPGTNTARQKVATAKTVRTKTAGKETVMTFVELNPLERAVASECIVELEHPRGAKMRVRLTGCQSPEVVAALSRVFLGAES
jgi:hypothetical protein